MSMSDDQVFLNGARVSISAIRRISMMERDEAAAIVGEDGADAGQVIAGFQVYLKHMDDHSARQAFVAETDDILLLAAERGRMDIWDAAERHGWVMPDLVDLLGV